MLTCSGCEEFINDYVDHRLADADAQQMLSHCAECNGCRTFLGTLLEVGLDRGRVAHEEVPGWLDVRVRSAVAGEGHAVKRPFLSSLRRMRIAVPIPVAALVLVLVVATGVYSLVGTKVETAARPMKRQAVTQVMSLPTIRIEK